MPAPRLRVTALALVHAGAPRETARALVGSDAADSAVSVVAVVAAVDEHLQLHHVVAGPRVDDDRRADRAVREGVLDDASDGWFRVHAASGGSGLLFAGGLTAG